MSETVKALGAFEITIRLSIIMNRLYFYVLKALCYSMSALLRFLDCLIKDFIIVCFRLFLKIYLFLALSCCLFLLIATCFVLPISMIVIGE